MLKVKHNFSGQEATPVTTAVLCLSQKIPIEQNGIILWERTEAYGRDFAGESDALTPANTIPSRKNVVSTET